MEKLIAESIPQSPPLTRFPIRWNFGEVGWVGASQVITAASRVLILTIVARNSQPDTFGRFAFFVGIALVVSNLTELGLGRTLVRFVGVAQGKRDFEMARGYSTVVLRVKIVLSVAILLVGLLLIRHVGQVHDSSLIAWALATGLLSSFAPLLASIFQVRGRFPYYFLAYCVDPVRLVVIVILSAIGATALHSLLLVYLVTPIALVLLWPATGLDSATLFQRLPVSSYLELWSFGRWLFLIALLESLWQRLDVLMLEPLAGAHEVGIYSATYMFMGVAALVAGSIGTVVYPHMAEAHGRRDHGELAKQYLASTNVMAFIGLPCVFGVAALGPNLIRTILGDSYLAGAGLIPWLALYGASSILQMNAGAVFFAVGRPASGFFVLLFLVVSGAIGNLLYIPRWHSTGAAAVLGVTTAMAALMSWSIVASFIRVWPDFREIALLLGIATLMFVGVKFIPLPISGTLELVGRILIGVLVYFGGVKLTYGSLLAPLTDFLNLRHSRPA